MRFKISSNVYFSTSDRVMFSCSITWPNLQCLPDHEWHVGVILLSAMMPLCFSNKIRINRWINRIFTKYISLGRRAWQLHAAWLNINPHTWFKIRWNGTFRVSNIYQLAYSPLHFTPLNYLPEQNQVDIATSDHVSHQFLSLFIHSCDSVIYSKTNLTSKHTLLLEQFYLNWAFKDEH